MTIITAEMKYLQRLCEYAKKHGVAKAARRYHTYRQFVYRQLERYNGDVRSLALKSRKPIIFQSVRYVLTIKNKMT